MSEILLDSNILLRLANEDDQLNPIAVAAVRKLGQHGQRLLIVPQCVYEFYVVATRPRSSNGFGLTALEALTVLTEIESIATLLPEPPELYQIWRELIEQKKVLGKPAHDARLVAAMQTHQIHQLLTFNITDFRRYEPVIKVVDPNSI